MSTAHSIHTLYELYGVSSYLPSKSGGKTGDKYYLLNSLPDAHASRTLISLAFRSDLALGMYIVLSIVSEARSKYASQTAVCVA